MSAFALVSFVPESQEGKVEGPGGHRPIQGVRSGRGTLDLGEPAFVVGGEPPCSLSQGIDFLFPQHRPADVTGKQATS